MKSNEERISIKEQLQNAQKKKQEAQQAKSEQLTQPMSTVQFSIEGQVLANDQWEQTSLQLQEILIIEDEKIRQLNQMLEQNEKIKTILNDEIDRWSAGFRNFQELNTIVTLGFNSIESRQNTLTGSLQEVTNSLDRMKLKIKEERIFGLVLGAIASSLIWLIITKMF